MKTNRSISTVTESDDLTAKNSRRTRGRWMGLADLHSHRKRSESKKAPSNGCKLSSSNEMWAYYQTRTSVLHNRELLWKRNISWRNNIQMRERRAHKICVAKQKQKKNKEVIKTALRKEDEHRSGLSYLPSPYRFNTTKQPTHHPNATNKRYSKPSGRLLFKK